MNFINMKKIIFTLTFLFASFIAMSQSQISLSELTHDFGTVELTQDTLVVNFWFKNIGSGDLEIYSAKSSCGCTVVSFPQVTSPGNGGSIVVKYYNPNPGFINKSVTIITNDPNNSAVILRIKGETIK